MGDTILDALKALGFDRTADVRKELCRMVAVLCASLPMIAAFQARLLALLLSRAADDQQAVAAVAVEALEGACAALSARGELELDAGVC